GGARGHDGSRAVGQPAARLPGAADRLSRLTRPTADQNGGADEGGERPAPPPCPPPEGEGNGPRLPQEGEGNVWQRYGPRHHERGERDAHRHRPRRLVVHRAEKEKRTEQASAGGRGQW